MNCNFIEIVKKYSALLLNVERIYVFGSVLNIYKTPNDIDILLIYSEYNSAMQCEIEQFVKRLESEIDLPIDLTILSHEEEREVSFLNRIKSLQLK